MAHIIVQVIQMLVCIGLGAAVIAIFAVAVITIVHWGRSNLNLLVSGAGVGGIGGARAGGSGWA
jgi:hypothetical protein